MTLCFCVVIILCVLHCFGNYDKSRRGDTKIKRYNERIADSSCKMQVKSAHKGTFLCKEGSVVINLLQCHREKNVHRSAFCFFHFHFYHDFL